MENENPSRENWNAKKIFAAFLIAGLPTASLIKLFDAKDAINKNESSFVGTIRDEVSKKVQQMTAGKKQGGPPGPATYTPQSHPDFPQKAHEIEAAHQKYVEEKMNTQKLLEELISHLEGGSKEELKWSADGLFETFKYIQVDEKKWLIDELLKFYLKARMSTEVSFKDKEKKKWQFIRKEMPSVLRRFLYDVDVKNYLIDRVNTMELDEVSTELESE